MPTKPHVLLVSSQEIESQVLENVLKELVVLDRATDLADVKRALARGRYDAVFCGHSFHKNDWNAVLRQIQNLCPEVPVVIFCRTGGEREWIEVLDAGAFDLLLPPYQRGTVLPILEHAVASYEARRLHGTPAYAVAKAG
jgi:DNA-binding NtrC family response regulator